MQSKMIHGEKFASSWPGGGKLLSDAEVLLTETLKIDRVMNELDHRVLTDQMYQRQWLTPDTDLDRLFNRSPPDKRRYGGKSAFVLYHSAKRIKDDPVASLGAYHCALIKSLPTISFRPKMLDECARLSPLVDQQDNLLLRTLMMKRKVAGRMSLSREAVQRFYVRSIQNTLEIEDIHFSKKEIEGAMVADKTKLSDEAKQLLGMLDARHEMYRLVRIAQQYPTSSFEVEMLKSLHRMMMKDTLQGAGEYRREEVKVDRWIPPEVQQVEEQMAAFEQWLNSGETTANIHPVELAALAHIRFVEIHPFEDGNGRISRLLVDYLLLRSGYPPIFEYDRLLYYDALHSAHAGDLRPFMRLMVGRVLQSLSELCGVVSGFRSSDPTSTKVSEEGWERRN